MLTVLMRNYGLRGSSAGVNGKVSNFTIACPSSVCASLWFNRFHHDKRTGGSESADSRLRLVQDRPQSSALRRFGERAHEIHWKNPGRSLRGWKLADGWKTAASEALTNWSDWTELAPKLLDVAVENREQETSEWTVTEIAKRAEAGKAPKPIAAKHFNWTPMAKDQEPKKVLTNFFQELYSIPDDQAVFAQKEKDALNRVMEELESGLRSGFVDFDDEAAWGAGQAEEREGLPRWHHCRCTERAARGLCGKTGMSTVEDVLGHEVPARVVVLVNGHGPEGRGCIEKNCEVQADLRGCVRCERYCAMYGSSHCPLHDARQSRQRLCRRHMQTLACSCWRKQRNFHASGNKKMVIVQLDVKKAYDQWTIERRSKRRDCRV